ncbi:xylose isomerase-like protein [Sordaria brevicollis]|uniref:Apurinic-apyrimidinic endonuclease 1 n=1 Tax=Sordaria brevicollis TaxID=83679 RepID=A0AAE0PD15_SORBR|nr:xylose isomerase-like protein [Sordaria brevicollis]
MCPPSRPTRSAKSRAATKITADTAEEATVEETTVKRTTRGRGAVKKEEVVEEKKVVVKKVAATKRKGKSQDDEDEDIENKDPVEEETKKPAPKKRKTKASAEEDAAPLAARTPVESMKRKLYIGAHVSSAGGVQNSITNAVHIGANAFAVFLKSQRKWVSPPLDPSAASSFHDLAKLHSYSVGDHVLPHGSYLVNLAQIDKAKADQAYANFVDDLQRCATLGIKLYNFHPGSTGGEPIEEACARIASQLNRAHKEPGTGQTVTVIENMCGSGNVIGSRFEELAMIIDGVEDKSRVGVCIDTCHAFAAGHDLRTPEAFAKTMQLFDEIVGLKYLKAFHLNDSKAPFGSHRDLHANIGTGFLGLRAFHNLMNYEPVQGLPMVLETPIEEKGSDGKMVENKQIWADEIKLLESLVGMDVESEEFKKIEEELQKRGASERAKIQEQVDKKAEKDAKKAEKDAAKAGKKGLAAAAKGTASISGFFKKKVVKEESEAEE